MIKKLIVMTEKDLFTEGYVPANKNVRNVRFLYLNPNGFNIHYTLKLKLLFKFLQKWYIDSIQMKETVIWYISREKYDSTMI